MHLPPHTANQHTIFVKNCTEARIADLSELQCVVVAPWVLACQPSLHTASHTQHQRCVQAQVDVLDWEAGKIVNLDFGPGHFMSASTDGENSAQLYGATLLTGHETDSSEFSGEKSDSDRCAHTSIRIIITCNQNCMYQRFVGCT